jgi:hypothetical protein
MEDFIVSISRRFEVYGEEDAQHTKELPGG